MCFFYGLPITKDEIEKKVGRTFAAQTAFEPQAKINGFSHPFVPIVTPDTPYITMGEWGLMPSWATEASFQKNTLNARIETLDILPSFKDYTQNRCLILASYFYEWRHEGKTKIPYTIYSQDSEILYMAGIYNDWQDPALQTTKRTFSIVTTQANTLMEYIHNHKKRMPVVVEEKAILSWLDGENIEKFAFPYEAKLCGFKET